MSAWQLLQDPVQLLRSDEKPAAAIGGAGPADGDKLPSARATYTPSVAPDLDFDLSAARDRAAQAAVAHVASGMTVGLGSGDTAARAIRFLGARHLEIIGVAT